jgi:trans-aconitate methyltransferase
LDIKEFISSLPESVVKGDSVALSDGAVRRVFKFAELSEQDVFYHLGCGDGNAVALAAREFKVKKSVGVEIDNDLAAKAYDRIASTANAKIINADIRQVDISEATVILFWFADSRIVSRMVSRFKNELQVGARVITIWSPPGMMLPSKVDFPFFMCRKPFKNARSIRDQIKAAYGNRCIDFTAAWILAEKYIDALEAAPGQYRRFVNILQSMVIWINAWNMKVACEDEIPPPVESYLGILRTFFNIDLSGMILRGGKATSQQGEEEKKCC